MFQRDPNNVGVEPLTTSPEDGLEYHGEWLMDFGLTFPMAVSGRYKATHPVSWLLKGMVLVPTMLVWLILVGWWTTAIGIVLTLVGESWNDMQRRRGAR